MEIIIIYGDDGLIKIFSLENWKKKFSIDFSYLFKHNYNNFIKSYCFESYKIENKSV